MVSDRFYLACLRDTVGSNVAFHCVNGHGYSTNISKAHVYSKEEAQQAWDRGREFDLPLCAAMVDALSVNHVDCQYIPSESEIDDQRSEYVAFVKSRWDGNDVYWLRHAGLPTTNFDLAEIFDAPGDQDGLVWVPFNVADKAKRKTFDVSKINRRRMIQSAGLITPDHIKRHRRKRNNSGKTRWNCDGCGRINWQYNPYDFDGCSNSDCGKHRYEYA